VGLPSHLSRSARRDSGCHYWAAYQLKSPWQMKIVPDRLGWGLNQASAGLEAHLTVLEA